MLCFKDQIFKDYFHINKMLPLTLTGIWPIAHHGNWADSPKENWRLLTAYLLQAYELQDLKQEIKKPCDGKRLHGFKQLRAAFTWEKSHLIKTIFRNSQYYWLRAYNLQILFWGIFKTAWLLSWTLLPLAPESCYRAAVRGTGALVPEQISRSFCLISLRKQMMTGNT